MDANEEALLKALETVDSKGDVGPPGDDTPMSSIMRETLAQNHMIQWNLEHERFFLTSTGRERLGRRRRGSGTVVPFPRPETAKKADGTNG